MFILWGGDLGSEVISSLVGYSQTFFFQSFKLSLNKSNQRKTGNFTKAGALKGRMCFLLEIVLASLVFTELMPSAKNRQD